MEAIIQPPGKILGPDGKPVDRVALLHDYGMDSRAYNYRGYTFLPNEDELVDRKGIEIYDTMMNEVVIENSINALRYAIISTDFEIVPASENPGDIQAADFVRWNFENLDGSIRMALFEILSSMYRGFSVTEKIFDTVKSGPWAGKWAIKKFKGKWAGDYEIKVDDYMNIIDLKINVPSQAAASVPLDKFILHVFNQTDGKPHGRSLLRKVYKHYWSKDFLLKWWNIYLETFGMPTRIAQYPAGVYLQNSSNSQASQNRLQEILADIMQATAITIPDDIKLEFKEASMGGAVSFLKAIEYHDRMMTIGIQGQTLTQQADAPGSYALARVHESTKSDYTDMLRAHLEDAVMAEQVIKQLVDLNFNVSTYPRFIMSPRPRQLEDLTADELTKLAAINILKNSDIDLIRRRIGLPSIEQAAAMDDVKPDEPIDVRQINIPGQPAPGAQPYSGFSMSRKPNDYEYRTDFKKMDRDMDAAVDGLIENLSPIVNNMKLKTIAYLPNLFTDGKTKLDMSKWAGLTIPNKKEFTDVYRNEISNVMADQMGVAYGEVDNAALSKMSKYVASIKLADQIAPEEELALIAQWQESGDAGKLKAWRERKAAELSRQADAEAFWITDVVRGDILREVKDTIMSGVKNGADIRRITKAVGNVFEGYIERGDIANKQLAAAPRLEAIVRTNVNRAFNVARRQAFSEAAATGDFPAWEFSAILDDRTSDICESLDGKIYAADDPIWGTITPPLHYNCRSQIVPVYKTDIPSKWSNVPTGVKNIPVEFGGAGGA